MAICGYGSIWVNPPCESTSDRVKRLEKEREATDKALADAKAKLAAEEAEKNKTYGEKVAEKFVVVDGKTFNWQGDCYRRAWDGGQVDIDCALERARCNIAAAIDKAYADGAAEVTAKMEKVADEYGRSSLSWSGTGIAKYIRLRLKQNA